MPAGYFICNHCKKPNYNVDLCAHCGEDIQSLPKENIDLSLEIGKKSTTFHEDYLRHKQHPNFFVRFFGTIWYGINIVVVTLATIFSFIIATLAG